jgi:MFS family permease
MVAWILVLNAIFNFCLGAMLPLLPALSPEGAGVAFSAFSLMKVAFLLPAGRLSDALGHPRAVTVTLALQVLALLVIATFPGTPWIGRIIEGMALAQGTVSTVSLLRLASPSPGAFETSMGRLMGVGSLGFLAGPLVGYGFAASGPRALILLLLGITGAALVVQVVKMQRAQVPPSLEEPAARVRFAWGEVSLAVVIGLAAAKAIGIGWQPNVAWWATHAIGLGPELAGITFLVMGLAFAAGAAARARRVPRVSALVAASGIAGFALLEVAVRGARNLFWPAAALLGFWFGGFLTRAIALLGWNRPERLGRTNSAWMIATDLPMAVAPIIVWQWRDPVPGTWRAASGIALIAVATVGIARGERVTSVERTGR